MNQQHSQTPSQTQGQDRGSGTGAGPVRYPSFLQTQQFPGNVINHQLHHGQPEQPLWQLTPPLTVLRSTIEMHFMTHPTQEGNVVRVNGKSVDLAMLVKEVMGLGGYDKVCAYVYLYLFLSFIR